MRNEHRITGEDSIAGIARAYSGVAHRFESRYAVSAQRFARIADGQMPRSLHYEPGTLVLPQSPSLPLLIIDAASGYTQHAGRIVIDTVVVSPMSGLWEWDAGKLGFASKRSMAAALSALYRASISSEDLLSILVPGAFTPRNE